MYHVSKQDLTPAINMNAAGEANVFQDKPSVNEKYSPELQGLALPQTPISFLTLTWVRSCISKKIHFRMYFPVPYPQHRMGLTLLSL